MCQLTVWQLLLTNKAITYIHIAGNFLLLGGINLRPVLEVCTAGANGSPAKVGGGSFI